MQRLLCRHADGRVNFDAQVLTSDQVSVTRPVLRESIDRLFADPADVALLYFSGHGTENDLGGYLVTSDATLYDEGVPLADVLDRANLAKHIGEVAIIVDSCHSGALGNVPEVDNATRRSARACRSSRPAARRSPRWSATRAGLHRARGKRAGRRRRRYPRQRRGCRLTALGRYYWTLAAAGRI